MTSCWMSKSMYKAQRHFSPEAGESVLPGLAEEVLDWPPAMQR